MEKQEIHCKFAYAYKSFKLVYTCFVGQKMILVNSELEFTGKHLDEKTNKNVEMIHFNNCSMSTLPKKLSKSFQNLKYLYWENSKLKSIERDDLKQFTDLKELWCPKNEIKYLPGDLFVDHINLEYVDFSDSKIEFIEPNLLDGLEQLIYVDFSKNPSIDKYWNSIHNTGNATLQEIKENLLALSLSKSSKTDDKLDQASSSTFMSKSGLYDDLNKILQNEKLKDFIVIVNDEEFKVHKLILAARSPVLKEMIENNIDAESLNLIDISKDIFREILNFMYTDELPQSDDINFIHLYAASERLKIENLKKFAAEKLKEKINDENAIEVLALANKHNNEFLKRKSFKKIKEQLLDETIEISNDLASNPEKIKRFLDVKKKKDEMMRQMSLELAKLLKNE